MAGAQNVIDRSADTITVAVVEDDGDVCQGLASLINNSPGFICVAACPSAEEALVGLPIRQPDVVLMDIGLPGMSGIECIPRLKEELPGTQIMMLTVFEDHDRIFQALKAGATGYLLKKTEPKALLRSIRELREGGSPMSNQIARRVVQEFQRPYRNSKWPELSDREHQVLQKISQGYIYKEIAEALNISLETVRTHARNIYAKMQVRTREEALEKLQSH